MANPTPPPFGNFEKKSLFFGQVGNFWVILSYVKRKKMTQTVIQEKEGDRRGSAEEPKEVGRGCEKGSEQQREVNTEYQPVIRKKGKRQKRKRKKAATNKER